MAIYRLGDICSLKKGKGKFYKRHLNIEKDIIGYHYGDLYKHKVINNWDTYVSKSFYRSDNIVDVGEIMLIDVSESFDEIGHLIYNDFKPGLIGNHIIQLYDFKYVNSRWLYYYLMKNQDLFRQYSYGDKVASLKISDIENLKIDNIPLRNIQKEIIDIIEPIEDILNNMNKQISELKKVLVSQYSSVNMKNNMFKENVTFYNEKYRGQSRYLATNAVGEFFMELSKEQDINSKRPSRADLTPVENSLIISKLAGENKVFYIDENFSHVISTGFYNFKTDYVDHVVGFLLSDHYKEQKNALATGTTMVALNNEGVNKIVMKAPTNKNRDITKFLVKLIGLQQRIEKSRETLIKLMIQ